MRQFALFLAFLGGAALIVRGAVLWGYAPLWPLWVVAGLAVIAATIVSIRRKGKELRQAMLASEDVHGRWQVSQADLTAFHALDREVTAINRKYSNHLSIPKTAPAEGVPIVLGKHDWLIGTRLYRGSPPVGTLFGSIVLVDGDPGYIEVAMPERSSGAGFFLILLRVPVPSSARAAAQAATDALAARVPRPNFERMQRTFPDYLRNMPG